ncbi:MAG TPA: SIMPL domain-containing protein [Candidatus Pacearchaeota archaeon]|nr:SIMPL domain-containing protein [Candidatus Pacearchaeota archaeon]HOC53489.1 SIMPL domain-containing protein [Candidatus Pacearchaeota archaeon]HQM24436.1 SIMPL domain-containing protein [Candidatus Pacearchaeota archaeon]
MIKDFKNCGVVCKIIGVLLIILILVLISYYSAATTEKLKQADYIGRDNNVITVSKKGTVYATPNLVKVSFSIITEEKEVGDALKNNSQKSSAVIETLKAQGVGESDIKTTYYNVYPLYEWRKVDSADMYSTGTRVLVGYEARQTIEAKIRDVTKVSDIIDASVNAGANEVSGLSFIVENEENFKTQARTKAIIDARNEASQTAKTLGVKLGDIVSFTESTYVPYDYLKLASSSVEGMGSADSSSIATGENKIEVTVNITFEIK